VHGKPILAKEINQNNWYVCTLLSGCQLAHWHCTPESKVEYEVDDRTAVLLSTRPENVLQVLRESDELDNMAVDFLPNAKELVEECLNDLHNSDNNRTDNLNIILENYIQLSDSELSEILIDAPKDIVTCISAHARMAARVDINDDDNEYRFIRAYKRIIRSDNNTNGVPGYPVTASNFLVSDNHINAAQINGNNGEWTGDDDRNTTRILRSLLMRLAPRINAFHRPVPHIHSTDIIEVSNPYQFIPLCLFVGSALIHRYLYLTRNRRDPDLPQLLFFRQHVAVNIQNRNYRLRRVLPHELLLQLRQQWVKRTKVQEVNCDNIIAQQAKPDIVTIYLDTHNDNYISTWYEFLSNFFTDNVKILPVDNTLKIPDTIKVTTTLASKSFFKFLFFNMKHNYREHLEEVDLRGTNYNCSRSVAIDPELADYLIQMFARKNIANYSNNPSFYPWTLSGIKVEINKRDSTNYSVILQRYPGYTNFEISENTAMYVLNCLQKSWSYSNAATPTRLSQVLVPSFEYNPEMNKKLRKSPSYDGANFISGLTHRGSQMVCMAWEFGVGLVPYVPLITLIICLTDVSSYLRAINILRLQAELNFPVIPKLI